MKKRRKRDEQIYYHKFFFKVLRHYFPRFKSWLNKLEEPRMINKCRYPLHYMVFMGVIFFILKIGTRRQLKYKLNSKKLIKNINKYLDIDLESLLHYDTLEYFCRKFCIENLELLRKKMIQRLIRMKKLVRYRLFDKYYLIALDGTGNLTYKERHCDKCLTRKTQNGEIRYYHPVLEAKLITANGLALSIGTEFIENEKGNTKEMSKEDSQDCEIKAGYRLLKKIKKKYPQLNICILADSLYANKEIMQLCKDYGWKYIITFKKGSIPNVYKEFELLKRLAKGNNKIEINKKDKQEIEWINDIEHETHQVNIVECREIKKKNNKEKTFCYISNFKITKENAEYLVNKGGRLRWKIENEGFNMQKNGGYNLEHKYSSNNTAIKNYYLFMQIAHIINQLVEKSNLLKQQQKYFGSIKNLSERLIAELIFLDINFDKINSYSNFYVTLDTG